MKKHHELALDVAPGLAFWFSSFIFVLKVLFSLYRGIDQKVLAAYDYCHKQGVNTKLAVVILGRDDLVLAQDYTNFSRMAALRHLPIYKFVFENEEHASVAHKWRLIDALEALELVKTRNLPTAIL